MGISRFGKTADPIKNGRKGGKVKSTKKTMVARMRTISKLPYEEFINKIHKIDANPNLPAFMTQLMLSGEKGMDYYIQANLRHFAEASQMDENKAEEKGERRAVIKERLYTAMNVKDNLYGKKTRVESKEEITIDDNRTIQEISEIYERAKKGFTDNKKSTNNNK